MENMINLIKKLGRTHGNLIVFQDFLQMMSATIIQPFCDRSADYYAPVVAKYNEKEMLTFAEIGACLVEALSEDIQDVLGEVYMQLKISDVKGLGQVFTSLSIASCMAELLGQSPQQAIQDHGFVFLNEPTCGSGAMILAYAKMMKAQGYNPQQQLFVIAQDLDIKGVFMTYIQLSLLGIPAVVIHGNTLSGEIRSQWGTPFYCLQQGKFSQAFNNSINKT